GALFVPSETLRLVHERSTPDAVLMRVGRGRRLWYAWKRDHAAAHPWLFDWLYDRTQKLPAGAGDLLMPTEEMRAFREEASIRATARASDQPEESVSGCYLVNLKREYRRYPWFERWLLRGEDPPPGVTVATAKQVAACRAAWDWVRHCLRGGFHPNTYKNWIKFGLIPDARWLRWLYGAPTPEGAFVVPPALQKLRKELSLTGISAAA